MKAVVEHIFTGTTALYTAYDSTKTMLGQWIQQKTGNASTDKYAGPFPITVTRPLEFLNSLSVFYPHVIDWGSNLHWVFLAESAAAATTRRILLYTFNTATQTWGWRGFVTLTHPSGTNATIRGMKIVRSLYTTGTVTVSGTAVTGSSTAWQTARFAVGARIGFGSTDPAAITAWYYISAITNDTSITLTGSVTVGAGSSYVIEEIRVVMAQTNNTTTSGGLFVTKGLNFDDFSPGGTAVAAAVSTDNLKAVYWLKDAATVTNTIAAGLALSNTSSNTSHFVYILNADAATTARVFKYDIRATLTVSSGASTDAFTFKTGGQTVVGTIAQTNGTTDMVSTSHGPGNGVQCMYCVTASRLFRIPEASITDGNTGFVSDSMLETPTGGLNTIPNSQLISTIEYVSSIDRFLVGTSSSNKHYVTQYQTVGDRIDRVLLCNNNQLNHPLADPGTTPFPCTVISGFSFGSKNGIIYMCQIGAGTSSNFIYPIPAGDWDYAIGSSSTYQNRLITPSLSTVGCTKFYRVGVCASKMLGSSPALGLPPEPFRIYYRTIGISDDTGTWVLVGDSGDLTMVNGAEAIQFMFEFRIYGNFCIPGRIYSVACTYEDSKNDSHYQFSIGNSILNGKSFAWRFATAFGTTVPTLTINIYDSITGIRLLTDTTTAVAYGAFSKSTDNGNTWGSYNTTDKANDTTYIRYIPTSLADSIRARAVITQ